MKLQSTYKPCEGGYELRVFIPSEALAEKGPYYIPGEAEFNPNYGISLDAGDVGWDDDTRTLHPESLPVALMRYAFMAAILEDVK